MEKTEKVKKYTMMKMINKYNGAALSFYLLMKYVAALKIM
jgi:hypothetical protein